MTYNIIGKFPSINDAISAADRLTKAGFIKEFRGFTKNTKNHPESLIEDHFIDLDEIAVYTPNLNRAHKAKNILIKFGGEIKKAKGIYCEKIQKAKDNTILIQYKPRRKGKESNIKN